MSGTLIEVTPKRTYNFDHLDQTDTLSFNIAERIDVSQWPFGTLMVNVFSSAITHASSTVTIKALADGFTTEDPSQDFVDSTAVATVTLNSTTNGGDFKLDSFSGNWGSMIAIQVSGFRASGDTDPISVDIQVRLAMKD